MLDTYLKDLPLIAILRGVTPDEIVAVGRALHDAGFRVIEIPLNSPQPYESIRRLTAELGESCLIGAGTVLTEAQVAEVDAAGRICILSVDAMSSGSGHPMDGGAVRYSSGERRPRLAAPLRQSLESSQGLGGCSGHRRLD